MPKLWTTNRDYSSFSHMTHAGHRQTFDSGLNSLISKKCGENDQQLPDSMVKQGTRGIS